MAFEFNLDKVKESLINAGREVESRAKDASAVAKIKIDIHNKEVFLEKQYALLGKAFYDAHKDEDVEENAYFPSIKEAEEELVRLNEELLSAQGAVVCPSCGVKQTEKHDYCSSCGTALKKEAAPEVIAEVSDADVIEVVEAEVSGDDAAKVVEVEVSGDDAAKVVEVEVSGDDVAKVVEVEVSGDDVVKTVETEVVEEVTE